MAIIGGGPGGYIAAIRAARLGARVCLVEKEELGGTCLNWGCIPTKTLLHGVEILETIRESKNYGIQAGEPSLDFGKLSARKDRVVKTLVSGVAGLMKSNGIEVIKGLGRFVTPQKVEVTDEKGSKTFVEATKTVVATGSVSADLPIPGIQSDGVIDSTAALQLKEIPDSMVIIGAGPIGLEFGTLFSALGTRVMILEMMPQILPNEDSEVASALEKSLKRFKMQILTGCTVKEVAAGPEGKKIVRASAPHGEKSFEARYVLAAVGRKANIKGLGLEEIGVGFTKKGVEVNEKMETNVPGVYAIGDVTGQWLLAHFASAQGEVAVENALGHPSKLNPRVVPRCVYTLPEVGMVGWSEKEAAEAGYKIKVGRFPFAASGKAMAIGQREGFVKIVADAKYDEILGVHIVGPHATDLIGEAVMAMQLEATAEEVARSIHPHPTLTEALMESAFDVNGMALHIPPRGGR
jgi:dihydrolipoamide dehydrogenase